MCTVRLSEDAVPLFGKGDFDEVERQKDLDRWDDGFPLGVWRAVRAIRSDDGLRSVAGRPCSGEKLTLGGVGVSAPTFASKASTRSRASHFSDARLLVGCYVSSQWRETAKSRAISLATALPRSIGTPFPI